MRLLKQRQHQNSASIVPIGIALLLLLFNSLHRSSAERTEQSASNRIVNGRDGSIEDFPHQLSLRRNSIHICGASVLDASWALTAAHCIDGNEEYPQVFSLRIGSTLRTQGGEIVAIAAIFRHPNYDAETMNYDVALLRTLQPKMLRGNFVKPIKLPEVGTTVPDNTIAIVSGWGHMSSSEHVLSNVLKYANVCTVNQSFCNDNLKLHGGITDAMFCAAARATDACQGDSGGPIQVNDTLIGVVSWGVGCADPHFPGVYARLAYPPIRLWIRLFTHF